MAGGETGVQHEDKQKSMSQGKLLDLKPMASSSSSRSKRRTKNELSAEMISAPLDDFRHTMHVGRGGDVFGDTSFLTGGVVGSSKGEGVVGGDGGRTSPDSGTWRFFSRTLRQVKVRRGSREVGSPRLLTLPPPDVSPVIKNAVSLPQLANTNTNGGLQGTMLPPNYTCSTEDRLFCYGVHSGFITLPRFSRLDRNSTESPPPPDQSCRDPLLDNNPFPLTRSDSLTSFTVDLGPSLMSEVLGLIDGSANLPGANPNQEEEEEEEPSSLFEMAVESLSTRSPTNSTVSTPQRGSEVGSRAGSSRGSSSRGGSSSPECTWHPVGVAEDGDRHKNAMPDASLRLPLRPEPTIEAARFQQAADMLARHYGGGSGGLPRREKAPYAFSEEEEEVKV